MWIFHSYVKLPEGNNPQENGDWQSRSKTVIELLFYPFKQIYKVTTTW